MTKKTPRASSHLTLRRAHRRQRQWSVHGWFCCFGASLAVFPSFVGRTQLLGIMDGVDQNDRTHRALVVDFGSGICKAGFASFLALCSFTLSSGPRCSGGESVEKLKREVGEKGLKLLITEGGKRR